MPDSIRFNNGISLEFVIGEDNFLGFGQVLHEDLSLRSPRLPMFVDIRTPGGELLKNFRIVQEETTSERSEFGFSAEIKMDGPLALMVYETCHLWNIAI